MIFRGTKPGESVVTENPKGGTTENVGRIQREDNSNLLGKMKTWVGGSRKSSNVIKGDDLSEVTFPPGDK